MNRPTKIAGIFLALLVLPAATDLHAELPDHPAIDRAPLPGWVDLLPFDELDPDMETPRVRVGPETEDHLAPADASADAGAEADASTDEEAEGDAEETMSDVRFLLEEDQVRLSAAGPASRYSRFVYRVESRTALESWSSWEQEFAPDYERLRLHHLRVRRDGRWSDRLAASEASILQREPGLEENVFDETRTLVVVLDDVRVGDVVDVAWSKDGGNPVFDGSYFDTYRLGWRTEVDRRRLIVDHPESRGLAYRTHAGADEPGEERYAGRRVRWTWDLRGLEALETESSVPAGEWQLPWVELGDVGSWGEVATWATPLFRTDPSREALAPVLGELRRRLGDDAAPAEIVRAARDWVQEEVRYFAHLMGPHSHTPHEPADILRRRYGDCKDKTYLLLHLLHARGLDAWPVFVHSRNGASVDRRLPSPGAFDHAIVGVRLPPRDDGDDGDDGKGERKVYVDPTSSLQGGGPFWVPDYGWGLEIRPGATGLTRVTASSEAAGRTEVVYRYEVPAESRTSEVEITSVYTGAEAERQRRFLDGQSPQDVLDGYVSYYTTDRVELEPREALRIEDDREANRIEIVESYDLTYIPASDDDPLLFDSLPRLIESQGLPTVPNAPEEREHDLSLPHPVHLVETLVVETEEPYTWEPTDLEVEEPWMRYRAESPGSGGSAVHQVTVRFELQTLADRIPVGDLAAYEAALEAIDDHTGYLIQGNVVDEDLQRHALRVLTIALGLLTLFAFVSVRALGLRDLL